MGSAQTTDSICSHVGYDHSAPALLYDQANHKSAAAAHLFSFSFLFLALFAALFSNSDLSFMF
jgi:hypothetical protein